VTRGPSFEGLLFVHENRLEKWLTRLVVGFNICPYKPSTEEFEMRKNGYPTVDLYSIGQEIMRASQFEEMYYSMEEDRDYWKNKCFDLLNQGEDHNKEMIGGLLSLALKMGESK
jgi:hypothetical protein